MGFLRELRRGRLNPCMLHAIHIQLACHWSTTRSAQASTAARHSIVSTAHLEQFRAQPSFAGYIAFVHGSVRTCFRRLLLPQLELTSNDLHCSPRAQRADPQCLPVLIILRLDYFVACRWALNAWIAGHVLSGSSHVG
jgi:hypothetical protein